jgi:hypothetical protein
MNRLVISVVLSIIILEMSAFDLDRSLERARKRLGSSPRRRSDRGVTRLDPAVLDCVQDVLGGQERPPMPVVLESIEKQCRRKGLKPPSRATVYKLMRTLPGRIYHMKELPPSVQSALYNLDHGSRVPGHQVAFYCFNHGDVRAMSFAAGMPWLALYQALRMQGYHARSRGLVEAAARARRIGDARA